MNPYDTLERQLAGAVRDLGGAAAAQAQAAAGARPQRPGAHRGAPTGWAARRWFFLGAAGVLAAAAIIASLAGRKGPPDLAARAYAATSGPGVIHWRTETVNVHNNKVTTRQRQEGWSADGVQHIVEYSIGRKPHVTGDTRIAHGRSTSYGAVTDLTFQGPAPTLANTGGVLYGDPFEAFRVAQRAGELVLAAPGRYRLDPTRLPGTHGRVASAPGSSQTITYVLDRRTALPVKLIYDSRTTARTNPPYQHAPARDVTTMTFAVYERLADTQANRARLKLLPHPGPSKSDPATLFAPLRAGRPLSARQRTLATSMVAANAPFALDLSRARQTSDGTVLIPGRGTICMMSGGGGSCASLRTVQRYGVGIGSSGRGQTVVVPDGVKTVRARMPHHPWRTFTVRDNVVHLPNGAYRYRLVR